MAAAVHLADVVFKVIVYLRPDDQSFVGPRAGRPCRQHGDHRPRDARKLFRPGVGLFHHGDVVEDFLGWGILGGGCAEDQQPRFGFLHAYHDGLVDEGMLADSALDGMW